MMFVYSSSSCHSLCCCHTTRGMYILNFVVITSNSLQLIDNMPLPLNITASDCASVWFCQSVCVCACERAQLCILFGANNLLTQFVDSIFWVIGNTSLWQRYFIAQLFQHCLLSFLRSQTMHTVLWINDNGFQILNWNTENFALL